MHARPTPQPMLSRAYNLNFSDARERTSMRLRVSRLRDPLSLRCGKTKKIKDLSRKTVVSTQPAKKRRTSFKITVGPTCKGGKS